MPYLAVNGSLLCISCVLVLVLTLFGCNFGGKVRPRFARGSRTSIQRFVSYAHPVKKMYSREKSLLEWSKNTSRCTEVWELPQNCFSRGFGLTFWDKIRQVGPKWSKFEGTNFWFQNSQVWHVVRVPHQFSWVNFSFFLSFLSIWEPNFFFPQSYMTNLAEPHRTSEQRFVNWYF